MIDLITGHQGVSHISAEQIADLQNAEMAGYGAHKVMRMDGGAVSATGLTVSVGIGYWRVNGYDMEIQEAEEILIDPTATGYNRIDNIYVEILQDIPSGVQRSELVVVQGEESASTPTPPLDPTDPELNTDILLQVELVCTCEVTDGAMTFTDETIPYELVTPEEIIKVKEWIRNNADVYSASVPHYRGEVVLNALDGKIYECNEFCSVGDWETNQSHFTEKTIVSILSELGKRTVNAHKYGNCSTAASTTAKTVSTLLGDMVLDHGAIIYVKMQYDNTATSPTLNVDSTGAKAIKGFSSTKPDIWWSAGDVVEFVYDGTYWVMQPTQGQVSTLNGALTWKLKGSFTSSTTLALPTSYNEILLIIEPYYSSNSKLASTFLIPKIKIDLGESLAFRGEAGTAYAQVNLTNGTLSLTNNGGTDGAGILYYR